MYGSRSFDTFIVYGKRLQTVWCQIEREALFMMMSNLDEEDAGKDLFFFYPSYVKCLVLQCMTPQNYNLIIQ